ncbi:Ig-like domain-containing protein [Candidatus Actinomarina]|nr:Ig-like domain-containing protein [Candidatus Actinomarina sp.]
MKRLTIALSLFLILQTKVVAANELNKDPFTMIIQEILVELGLLDTHATGINDKPTQKAIMSFQEKAGLEKIDGIVGDETFPKLLLGETAYTTTTTFIDTHPPQWAEDPLSIININNNWEAPKVMRATILWGHITDNVGIDKYQIYVDGELYTTIPGLGCITKCSSQSSGVNARISNLIKDNYHTIEVRACDEAGNCSTNNPTITKKFKETISVPTTTTTTLPGTPTVTITASQVSDGDTSADSSITLTFITSESTTNFAAGDVTVSGGTLSNFIGFGTEYAATFTPSAVGATTIDVAANTFTNTATGVNNVAATQFNWTYSTAPTMTITASEVSDGDTSNDSSLSLTFTASASTTDFAVGDISVSGGTLSNFSGSGTTYTATFTPSAAGATTIDVAGGAFTNAFSTNNTAATQFNWTYVVSSKLADCGDSSTNANRWVVSVIDEDDQQSVNTIATNWTSFRTNYPDRCFHLLEPYLSNYSVRSTPNGINSNLAIPNAFINELSAGTTFHSRVNRDGGSTASRSDWWDLIGADVLPSGAKIGLCIDNSGSMNVNTVRSSLNLFKQKAAAAGVTIVTGLNGNSSTYDCSGMTVEQWISGLRIDIN